MSFKGWIVLRGLHDKKLYYGVKMDSDWLPPRGSEMPEGLTLLAEEDKRPLVNYAHPTAGRGWTVEFVIDNWIVVDADFHRITYEGKSSYRVDWVVRHFEFVSQPVSTDLSTASISEILEELARRTSHLVVIFEQDDRGEVGKSNTIFNIYWRNGFTAAMGLIERAKIRFGHMAGLESRSNNGDVGD